MSYDPNRENHERVPPSFILPFCLSLLFIRYFIRI
uniref:Uncharacterized protein n=1 Tax=Anguilla anguilla TaxID=7936 RepID=A0A0E9PBX2_ANGAN